jgi:P4 family phage/plasmid primase-like protien
MPSIPRQPNIGAYRDRIANYAITCLEAGLVLMPLKLWDKTPMTGWTKPAGQIRTTADLEVYMAKYQAFGLGLVCGDSHVLAVDFDIRYKDKHADAGITRETFNGWLANNETLRIRLLVDAMGAPVHTATEDEQTFIHDGKTYTANGRHHFFRNSHGLGNTSGAVAPQIDTRGIGGYIVLPPTVIQRPADEGGTWHQYTVTSSRPNYADLPEAPQWFIDMLRPVATAKTTPRKAQAEALGLANIATNTVPTAGTSGTWSAQLAYDKAVSQSGTNGRNNTGLWLACQLRDGGLSEDEARQWMRLYQEQVDTQGDPYTKDEADATLAQAYKRAPREQAKYQGQRSLGSATTGRVEVIEGSNAITQQATLEPSYTPAVFGTLPLSDSGNADRFISATRGNVRYNESVQKWLVWDATQWKAWEDNRILSYARRVAEYIQVEADSVTTSLNADDKAQASLIKGWSSHAKASQNKPRIDAMVALAKGNVYSVATDYDTYLDYLPCTNGVIDLRDGALLQHSREMRYTKVTNIEYDATATCPQWLHFLATITGNDAGLMEYLQMQVGYSLTGRTDQQALFFMYGNGANGKSTFINVIAKLAGEYHSKIAMEAILDADAKGATPHLVALHGMRLTSGSEFPAGKRINESMIKDLTGGDEITGRGLYAKDPFTFRPINKFWLMGNYKPRITGTDNGIWRRLILLPFEHTIPDAERIGATEVDAMFNREMAGILAWAVQGAIAWYAHPRRASLPKPEAVTNAITEYRQEEDTLQRFISDECDVDGNLSYPTGDMLTTYRAWLEEQGERKEAWTQTRLTRELKRLGIVQNNGRQKYLGIRPRPRHSLDNE